MKESRSVTGSTLRSGERSDVGSRLPRKPSPGDPTSPSGGARASILRIAATSSPCLRSYQVRRAEGPPPLEMPDGVPCLSGAAHLW